jgi:ABC-type nitrate/sulfonate/bicarbonate transport system permease component
MTKFLNAFLPNEKVDRTVGLTLVAGWLIIAGAMWVAMTSGSHPAVPLLPGPEAVSKAFVLEWHGGVVYQLITSLTTSIEAIFLATVIGLLIVYASTIAAFKPPAILIGSFRFLSLAGITVIFMMMLGGHQLKVGILAFSMMTFFISDMLQVVEDIPSAKFDHARTLGLSKWQVLWQVVVRGTLSDAFESVRKNAAIAWMMLTSVEAISRSEGGIGLLLVQLQRSGQYSSIFAIQLLIFLVGMGQDRLLKYGKALVCPYTVKGR